eukprot:8852770-Pyramimonas_sp.AAC.1
MEDGFPVAEAAGDARVAAPTAGAELKDAETLTEVSRVRTGSTKHLRSRRRIVPSQMYCKPVQTLMVSFQMKGQPARL